MEEYRKLTCGKCGVELTPAKASFSYLKHSFHSEVLRCPLCGQVYIPETLAGGRMLEVENAIEDK